MNKKLTRRAVLKAAPVVAEPLLLGTAQANEPDAELIALFKTWETANNKVVAAHKVLADAEDAALDEYPERPVLITNKLNDGLVLTLSRKQIDQLAITSIGSPKDNEALRIERIAALDAYESQRDAIDKKHRCKELEKQWEEPWDIRDAIENRIAEIPSKSIAGIYVKLTIWITFASRFNGLDPIDDLVIDAVKTAGQLSGMRRAV